MASVLCGGTSEGARPFTTKSHILPEARRMESFTDTNVTSSASTVQTAADSMPPLKMGGISGGAGVESCGIAPLPSRAIATTPPPRTPASTSPPTTRPGKARFHGNGIGGGAAASRRTASMTETAKPDDGRISSSRERMELISASSCSVKRLIKPPSGAAQPTAAEVYCVRFPGRETVSPSPCPRAGRGSARQWRRPYRENKKELMPRGTSPAEHRPAAAPPDPGHALRSRRRRRARPEVQQCLRATPFAPGCDAVPNDRGSLPARRARWKRPHPSATGPARGKRAERPPGPYLRLGRDRDRSDRPGSPAGSASAGQSLQRRRYCQPGLSRHLPDR